MAKSRATFGKLQRERDKKAKAAAKRERRLTRPEEGEEAEFADSDALPQRDHQYDEGRLLEALAALHQSYEAGTVSTDEFETRREELTSRLRVD